MATFSGRFMALCKERGPVQTNIAKLVGRDRTGIRRVPVMKKRIGVRYPAGAVHVGTAAAIVGWLAASDRRTAWYAWAAPRKIAHG